MNNRPHLSRPAESSKPGTIRIVLMHTALAALVLLTPIAGVQGGTDAPTPQLEVGLAVRDITPALPIRLAGYAGRVRPADKGEHPLTVQALALRNPAGERFVLVALDNCEVSQRFMEPVVQNWTERFGLPRGSVAVVSSHTHSAPVLEDTLTGMAQGTPAELEAIQRYSLQLKAKLVEVVGAALTNFEPATLDYGQGQATFAMNRRLFQGDRMGFGDNPEGPVDWTVPVLRIQGANGAVRAVLFGYACHGTSVRTGDDWYVVSGEYMAYARQHLEAVYPGVVAMFLTGPGADCDPAPRGRLVHARQHGLELAGAIVGVLHHPMRPVRGGFKWAYSEVELPFADLPTRTRLEQDTRSEDTHVRRRAAAYLERLDADQPLPQSVQLPVGVLRFGDDLTFVLMGGEVVVDYSRRLKRVLANDHPWPVGYAYEVPCYIPSVRLLKEGGYEPDSSLIYYGFYGPFRGDVEERLVKRVSDMVSSLR